MSGFSIVVRPINVYVEGLTMRNMCTTKLGKFMSVNTIMMLSLLIGGMSQLNAYTVVTISTAAPAGLEKTFLTATTSQFLANVVPNPFASNTYSAVLFGLNPNYVAPGQLVPSAPCQLDQDISSLVQASTWTYIYGWRDGATYLEQSEIGVVATMGNLCQNATNFALISATTSTWNKATCLDTINAFLNQLYAVNTGTPTVILGEP
jgi:hypothetical protein